MELVKDDESYLLGVHRTKRKSVYGTDKALVQITHLHIPEKSTTAVGCSDGNIAIWKPKSDFKVTFVVPISLKCQHTRIIQISLGPKHTMHSILQAGVYRSNLKEHLGIVFQMIYMPATPNTPCLLLSCSADRTIKVWYAVANMKHQAFSRFP